MLRSAAAFMVPGARIPKGEDIKSACHGITTHPVNRDDMPVYRDGKGSGCGVWNFLRQMDGCKLQGVRVVHYTVILGLLHSIPYFPASSSAFLDG